MKSKIVAVLLAVVAVLLVVNIAMSKSCPFNTSCSQKVSCSQQAGAVDDVKSFKKTSFDEVTQHLHKNGDFYMYLSAEQTIANISEGCSGLLDTVTKDLGAEEKAKVNELLNVFKAVGLGEFDSVGVSSVPVSEEFFSRRVVTVHGKDKGDGLIWNLLAEENRGFSEILKLLPEETVFAHYNSLNVKNAFDWLDKMVKNSNDQEIQQQFEVSMQVASAMLGNDLSTVLGTLQNEMVIVGTLDESKMIELPDHSIQVPEFGLAVIVKTKDRTLFDLCSKYIPRTEAELKKDGTVEYLEFKENKTLSIIKPVIVQSGDKLILSLSKALSDKLLASNKKSLLESATFVEMSQIIPSKGVGFDYLSPKLNETFKKFMKDSFESEREKNPVPFMDQLLAVQQVLLENTSSFPSLYSVTEVIDRGYMNSAYSSQTTGDMIVGVALAPVAMVGVIAAVIVPFTASAIEAVPPEAKREANIREVDQAVKDFLSDNPDKTVNDVTWNDISVTLDYFADEFEDDFSENLTEIETKADDSGELSEKWEGADLEDFEVDGVVPVFENGKLVYK